MRQSANTKKKTIFDSDEPIGKIYKKNAKLKRGEKRQKMNQEIFLKKIKPMAFQFGSYFRIFFNFLFFSRYTLAN